MAQKKKEDKLSEALMKVALGFQIAETTEEYAEVDGELKLTKRKRTKKDVPPDLKAVQMLLGEGVNSVESMSEEELLLERERLLAILAERQEEIKKEGQVCVEKRMAVKKTNSVSKKKTKKTGGEKKV